MAEHLGLIDGRALGRVPQQNCVEDSFVARLLTDDFVSCEAELAQLLRKKATMQEPQWDGAWRADLRSLVSGRQWPQARVAAAKRLGVADKQVSAVPRRCWHSGAEAALLANRS